MHTLTPSQYVLLVFVQDSLRKLCHSQPMLNMYRTKETQILIENFHEQNCIVVINPVLNMYLEQYLSLFIFIIT